MCLMWRFLILVCLMVACTPTVQPRPNLVNMPLSSQEIEPINVNITPIVFVQAARSIGFEASVVVKANLRPSDAPDVVIIGFAGHCGPFCRTKDTWAYLDTAGDATGYVETAQSLIQTLESQDLEVAYLNVSSFVSSHYSAISEQEELGYLDAQIYLTEVKENWIADYINPTKIILLAHSHGTVWATLLAMNNLDVTFDYFIYLDAICWQFWSKHKSFIRDAYAELNQALPFPLDQGDPCSSFQIPTYRSRQDISDVVPANVITALEVRSSLRLMTLSPNVVFDNQANMRINGTKLGVFSIQSAQSHSTVNQRYGLAMSWINRMISVLDLPDHADYRMEDFVLPPAPEGYEYSPNTSL